MINLLPREDKFYRMLEDLGGHANQSIRQLKILTESDNPDEVDRASRDISHIKTQAKKSIESLTEEICRTLITPFDREDLREFSVVLYNVPKLSEKIKDRLLTHKLHTRNGDFHKFIIIIEREADAMEAVLKELSGRLNTKTIHAKAAVVHELEDQGDQLLGELIAEAFHDVQDTRELILRKDIYEMLEDVTDLYRDAANIALQIVLKHS